MIEKIPFGRTGHLSTRTIFGAAALAQVSQAEADQTLDLLLEYGVNHIDTAASYGEAELRIGPWMAEHRNHFFLATKTEARTYQGAREELHRSLERLQTDVIDLWQLHFLVQEDQWQTAFGPGGALEAFVEARREGLVHFLGITGHGVRAADFHRRGLERYNFEAVLLPYNYTMMQNQQYAASFEELVALCQARQIAVQTIKSLARGPWGDKTQDRATWYEPLEDPAAIEAAVHFVLKRPGFFLNTVSDIHLLPLVLDAAGRFNPDQAPAVDLAQEPMTPLFT